MESLAVDENVYDSCLKIFQSPGKLKLETRKWENYFNTSKKWQKVGNVGKRKNRENF